MGKYHIAVVVGSLRKDSFNRKLANAIVKLAPSGVLVQAGANRRLAALQPGRRHEPGRFRQTAEGRNHGCPGPSVRHARIQPLDARRAQERDRPCFAPLWPERVGGKPAGVLGASVGAIGTAMAQQHLRNVLAYLDVPTLGQPEAFIHVKEGLFDEAGTSAQTARNSCRTGWTGMLLG